MDDRCKKLRFRAWRRGFREIDLILGHFADTSLADLQPADLDAFECLLDCPDQDVYAWIVGQAAPAPEYDTPVLSRIRAYTAERAT